MRIRPCSSSSKKKIKKKKSSSQSSSSSLLHLVVVVVVLVILKQQHFVLIYTTRSHGVVEAFVLASSTTTTATASFLIAMAPTTTSTTGSANGGGEDSRSSSSRRRGLPFSKKKKNNKKKKRPDAPGASAAVAASSNDAGDGELGEKADGTSNRGRAAAASASDDDGSNGSRTGARVEIEPTPGAETVCRSAAETLVETLAAASGNNNNDDIRNPAPSQRPSSSDPIGGEDSGFGDGGGGTTTTTTIAEFGIDGMTCGMCAQAVRNAIEKRGGDAIKNVTVSLTTDSARVEWLAEDTTTASSSQSLSAEDIREAIESVGYEVESVSIKQQPPPPRQTSDRTATSPPGPASASSAVQFSGTGAFADHDDGEEDEQPPFATTTVAEIGIRGMTGRRCASTVASAIRRLENVVHASVSFESASARVEWGYPPTRLRHIAQAIENAGPYKVTDINRNLSHSRTNNVASIGVAGMTCSSCASSVKAAIEQLDGRRQRGRDGQGGDGGDRNIVSVSVSLITNMVSVEWKSPAVTLEDITNAIEGAGYTVTSVRKLSRSLSTATVTQHGDDEDTDYDIFDDEDDLEAPLVATTPTTRNGTSAVSRSNVAVTSVSDPSQDWERLRQRQARKVKERKMAFLWSLVGALPIFLITMVLPHTFPQLVRPLEDCTLSFKLLHRQFTLSVETLILWALATPVQFISGFEFYKMSYYALKSGRAGMDVLVALGTTASYAYALYGAVWQSSHMAAHFFETASTLVSFVLAGKWMQAFAVRRTSLALSKLMQLQARTAVKVTPATNEERTFNPLKDAYREAVVPIEQVVEGDLVKVLRGASVPADGVVAAGEMSVDESMVTGESLPILKTKGSVVLGGTICVEASSTSGGDPSSPATGGAGAAFVRVTGVGSSTALAQIVQLVQDAQTRAVPIQTFADRISAIFVPFVCATSLLAVIVWYVLCQTHVVPAEWYLSLGEDALTFSIMFGIACLVISCPCALGLATPTAVMVRDTAHLRH